MGSLTKPTVKDDDLPKLQPWEVANSMISSWILNMVEPKLQTSVAYDEIPKAMRDTLKRRYCIANIPKIHRLKTSIANCKGGLSVVEFYSKISDL